jgi:cation diffusion facilitator CzcD-associated flavoprotein CzcO
MSEHEYDVIIIGAGLSGVGAACHLQRQCPDRSFIILEGRDAIGGTWDLFRYPGIRSDSDMHTLGYSFKPWKNPKAIADGPSIRAYVEETARENAIEPHIRFRQRVQKVEWSSRDARWTVSAMRTDTGDAVEYQCKFLLMCAGYYSYRRGHTPEFPGRENFRGDIIHPQFWPEDLDYSGKRVVVIGSGATAMTLVPSMAEKAASITMLQRSPTYVASRPDRDRIANALRALLPERWAYAITRWKNVMLQQWLYRRTRTAPEKVREWLLGRVRRELGPDYDVDTHFTPRYDPWDQRLCLIPNNDLLEAIRQGRASVVTDTIEQFTENGIRLDSGKELEADIIVTATGLKLVILGEAEVIVDGEVVDFAQTWTYKGLMYSGVPNLITTFGYINASWTLRADLTAEYACRVLNHMKETGAVKAIPRLRPEDRDMKARDWIEGFSAGYMRRDMHLFPRQGDREPWINPQDYRKDRIMFRNAPLEDGALVFEPATGHDSGNREQEEPLLRAAS